MIKINELFSSLDYSNYLNDEEKFSTQMEEMIKTYVESKRTAWYYKDLMITHLECTSWQEGNIFDEMDIEVKVCGKDGGN